MIIYKTEISHNDNEIKIEIKKVKITQKHDNGYVFNFIKEEMTNTMNRRFLSEFIKPRLSTEGASYIAFSETTALLKRQNVLWQIENEHSKALKEVSYKASRFSELVTRKTKLWR